MIQLPPLATHGAVRKRTEFKTCDGGGRSFVAGRTPKPVTGIEIGRPDNERRCRKSFFEPAGHPRDSTGGLDLEGCRMSEARNFRRWAAQVARQAGEEPDANEAQRLLSIAEYWVRLAEMEDWQRDRPGQDTSH
jgi:hypothetical protein